VRSFSAHPGPGYPSSAQGRYTYFSFETYNKANNTYYLVVSAPVKSWRKGLSPAEKEGFIQKFKAEANKRAGRQMMSNEQMPLPADADYERYPSFSQCKKAVWEKMDRHEAMYKKLEAVKVIYVQQ